MTSRLPPDAFDVYVALGPARSYRAVAERFGVSKRAVTARAALDNWQGRLAELETKARARSDEHLVDLLEEMNARHLKTCRVIQAKGLQALQSMPLDSAMNAVRALDLAMRQERLALGEPTDRAEVTVEDTIKREYARWMKPA